MNIRLAVLPVFIITFQLVGIDILAGIAVSEECKLDIKLLHLCRYGNLLGIVRHYFRNITFENRVQHGKWHVVYQQVGNDELAVLLVILHSHKRRWSEGEEACSSAEEDFLAKLITGIRRKMDFSQTVFPGKVSDVAQVFRILTFPGNISQRLVERYPDIAESIAFYGEGLVIRKMNLSVLVFKTVFLLII